MKVRERELADLGSAAEAQVARAHLVGVHETERDQRPDGPLHGLDTPRTAHSNGQESRGHDTITKENNGRKRRRQEERQAQERHTSERRQRDRHEDEKIDTREAEQ